MQPCLEPFLLALTSRLEGPIYTPGSEGYAPEITPFNTAVEHTPDVVIGAMSNTDIVETVRLARQYGHPISIQTTGHGALEAITGVLISTRRMSQVSIDADSCIAMIAAGVRWGSVIDEAAKYGLAPIAGSSTDVGVVGYILGGGLGPLARSHGFSSDYLTGLTVVTDSGELLEASTTENPDLFWALRGGKVGLGIVTEVRLRLVKLEMLYAGSLYFEEKDIEAVLRAWADWTTQADPLVTTSVAIIQFPSFAAIPEMFRGRRLLTLRFAYPGEIEDGVRLAHPLRSCAPVYFDALGELPASEVGRVHNDPSTPAPFWASSVLLNRIDQDFISTVLAEFGAGRKTPFGAVEIRHIGAATLQDVKEGSAVGGRSAAFAFSLVGRGCKEFENIFSMKADELLNALQPCISEEGNINLMGKSVLGKHFKRLWSPDISNKLMEIKRKYSLNNHLQS
jgi:hypothetical protein